MPEVYERSYLGTQLEEYLQQQLTLEKMASEIIFHTINITNALSPDEYFEQISRPAIQDMFAKDPFGKFSFYFFIYFLLASRPDEPVSFTLMVSKRGRTNE